MAASDRQVSEYELDSADRIIRVSPAFLEFAQQNDAPEITTPALINRHIWDFVAGTTTRELYAALFQKVRSVREPVRFPFRCDSPTRRRYMEMDISPAQNDGLCLTAILISVEDRPAVALLDPRAPRLNELLEVCSFCLAVRVADDLWMATEYAIRHLVLFDNQQLPTLSHGVCPSCLPELQRRLR